MKRGCNIYSLKDLLAQPRKINSICLKRITISSVSSFPSNWLCCPLRLCGQPQS